MSRIAAVSRGVVLARMPARRGLAPLPAVPDRVRRVGFLQTTTAEGNGRLCRQPTSANDEIEVPGDHGPVVVALVRWPQCVIDEGKTTI